MPAELRYKLGGVQVAPSNGVDILRLTGPILTPLSDIEQVRMRTFPISRPDGASPVYVRFSVAGRRLYNMKYPYISGPAIQMQVTEGGRQLAQIWSGDWDESWPISVCEAHGVASVTQVVVPPSDDPGHGSTDVELRFNYAIWFQNPLVVSRPDPTCNGPDPYSDPRAFEWSAISVEFFTT